MYYFFYTLKPVHISDLSGDDINVSLENSFGPEIILTFRNSSIRIVPKEGEEFVSDHDVLGRFEILTPNDITILKYLYENHNVLFYDEQILEDLEFFNPEKDKKFYDNTLREYIVDCMLFHGMDESVESINLRTTGYEHRPFVDEYYVRMGMYVRLQRMKRQLFWSKVKLFFKKILNKILFKG